MLTTALGAVSAMYLLALTTPIHEITSTLSRLHVPGILIELMYLIYRFIFLLSDTAHQMHMAAQSRLGYWGWRQSMQTFGKSMANLLVTALRQAGNTYDAMVARCYTDVGILDRRKTGHHRCSGGRGGISGVLGGCVAAGKEVFMKQEPLLELRNLRYSYDGKVPTLDIAHFLLRPGEKVAVLGANGAGKSTFFLCLNGVLPAQGEILYRGTAITKKNRNALRKNVGIVFQDPDQQIIASTVAGEVSFGPMNLRLPLAEVRRRVEASLAYMNIQALRDRPPHDLSGGEKKRVSIADIIAMEPEVIVFDEPTVSLDPENLSRFEDLLAQLKEEGRTVLISTHDVDFAYRWADRVVLLQKGRIEADGETGSVMANESVLRACSLRPPMLMEISRMLMARGLLPAAGEAPRTLEAIQNLLQEALI